MILVYIFLPLTVRSIFISVFICRKYILIFKYLNQNLNYCFETNDKKLLKSLLRLHYKICESLNKTNHYLKTNFIIFIISWILIICFANYYSVFSKVNSNVILLALILVVSVDLLLLSLSILIARMDIEAMNGLQFIHGLALNINDKDLIFKVK